MRSMMEILRAVNGLAVAQVSEGADAQARILCAELPFRIFTYPSGEEFNGWIVPRKWKVLRAEIKKNGRVIYNGIKHPLGVVGYAKSFKGKVGFEELKKHLFYKKDAPSNIVYHCDFYYKPHVATWGFSVPYNLYRHLTDSYYDVDLKTRYAK